VPQWRDKPRDVRDMEKRDFGLFGGLNPFAAQRTQTLQSDPALRRLFRSIGPRLLNVDTAIQRGSDIHQRKVLRRSRR
jgi:hypothetical protein